LQRLFVRELACGREGDGSNLSFMSEGTTNSANSPVSPAQIGSAPSSSIPKLDPLTVLAALSNPTRWQAVQLLAAGGQTTALQLAKVVGLHFNTVGKHLQILRAAGVVESKPWEQDRRWECYYMPRAFRTEDGVVDLGFCVLRIASARPPMGKD